MKKKNTENKKDMASFNQGVLIDLAKKQKKETCLMLITCTTDKKLHFDGVISDGNGNYFSPSLLDVKAIIEEFYKLTFLQGKTK